MSFRWPFRLRFPWLSRRSLARRRVDWGQRVEQRRLRFGALARTRFQRAQLWRLAALIVGGGAVLAFLVFLGLVAWVAKDLPNPDEVRKVSIGSTQILDRNGEALYNVGSNEQRTPIKLDIVPLYLQQATIAIEDKDFYKHKGFDPLTPFRIVYNVVFNRRVIGGSTLTQQLVKNALLTNERTPLRKLRELILALEIERQFSKQEILQMYLNETPYGGTAVGAGAASQLYFDKDVSQLSLVESAVLAGLPQRPTAYSPFLNRTTDEGQPLWQWRAEGVLRRMREDGYIDEALEKQAMEQLKSYTFARSSVPIQAPHFVFYVQDQLEEMFGPEVVEQGGLVVKTTLDLPYQQEVQQIVKEEIDKVTSLKITNGAAIAMDPTTGEILSMVGSKDYFATDIPGQFNVAVDGLRQPGSSIKPVTYVTALKQGKTPATTLMDAFTVFAPNDQADAYEPRNYDGKFRGPMSLRRALAESNNVVAVKLLSQVGVKNMLQTATDMGFQTLAPTNDNLRRFGLSVTLGGAEVHLIDTVTAYSSFANGGTQVAPVSILEVKDSQGKVLYQHKPLQGKKVLEPDQAFLINSILSDDEARSGAFGRGSQLNIQNLPIAVKTGTTNDQRDNWTIGWSRSTMVGVWVGNNDNSPMTRVASGVTGASPIWRRAMLAAIGRGRKAEPWATPENVERVQVDAVSGYPAHDDLPAREEWVRKGTLPTEPDPIHRKVKLCRGENKLASAADIQRGNYEEKVFITFNEADPISQDGRNRWMEGILNWINGQSDRDKYLAPTEYCGSTDEVVVLMEQPKHETTYSESNIKVEVRAISNEAMDRVEIYVNGSLRETLRNAPYTTTLNLPQGRYVLYAKAFRKDGKEGKSGDIVIGTGGADWRAPSPTPTPSPSPTPVVSPLPTPSILP